MLNLTTTIGLSGLAALALFNGPVADENQCGARATLASDTVEALDLVETAAAAGNFATLLQAATAAGIAGALQGDGPFTVFAPTDEAFGKLDPALLADLLEPENREVLRTILEFHVVPGAVDSASVVGITETRAINGQRLAVDVDDSGVHVAGATVTAVDVKASNGIIHVIDRVMIPNTEDVIGTALGDGRFGTLAQALTAGGLVEALRGEGPFTVFAPTDEAFAALDPQVLADLLKPENVEQLQAVLKYHVVPGRLSARSAVAAGVAQTLQGDSVRLQIENGQLMVEGARVIASDVDATNGVVHVIDAVLVP
ncbi:MAG: fasciclin domain-containing protein [Planctomycetota bacterium]|jgi:uncharacterized surface protein with fasciclin (FAS1) repeats